MNPRAILGMIALKRQLHPELGAPLGWHGFQQILEREQISLRVTRLPRPAQLVQYAGNWTILLDSETNRHLHHGTHELGHLWLHHDLPCERWERVYNTDHWDGPDPREEEAELFSALVIAGPRMRRSLNPLR